MVASGERHQRQGQRENGQGDEESGDLVKPFAVKKVVGTQHEQAGIPDGGNGPRNREEFAAKQISFFPPLDACFAICKWVLNHAGFGLAWVAKTEVILSSQTCGGKRGCGYWSEGG